VRGLQERRPVVAALTVSRRSAGWIVTILVAAVVVAVDQVTKSWALDHLTAPRHVLGPLYLVLTFNRGAAFSLGTGVSPIVEAVVIVLVVALVGFGGRLNQGSPLWVSVALGLLLGGALGNLGDRLLRDIPFHHGAVVDFIQAVTWWPVFNVADASIVVGVALLALYYWRRDIARRSDAGDTADIGR
jgi:signal peptidase II